MKKQKHLVVNSGLSAFHRPPRKVLLALDEGETSGVPASSPDPPILEGPAYNPGQRRRCVREAQGPQDCLF